MEKSKKNRNITNIIKMLLVLAALCVAYLFALNGRYEDIGSNITYKYDNWTNTKVKVNR